MVLTIAVTEEEMNIIVNALAQAPYGMVHALMPKLEAQCKAQMGQPAATPVVVEHNPHAD